MRTALLGLLVKLLIIHAPIRSGTSSVRSNFWLWSHEYSMGKGVAYTSRDCDMDRQAFQNTMRQFVRDGTVQEHKTESTKAGNRFTLTDKGLDVACMVAGLPLISDCMDVWAELMLQSDPFHEWDLQQAQRRHRRVEPDSLHTIETKASLLAVVGLVTCEADLAGYAYYRLTDKGRTEPGNWQHVRYQDRPQPIDEAEFRVVADRVWDRLTTAPQQRRGEIGRLPLPVKYRPQAIQDANVHNSMEQLQ